MKRGHLLLLTLAFLMAGVAGAQEVVVFAYRGMPKSDAATLKQIGRAHV